MLGYPRHYRAGTISWVLSCVLHGSLVIGSLLFVQRIRLAPEAEPFKWNVAMVSSEQADPAASQMAPQRKEPAKPVTAAPVRRSAPPTQIQAIESPPVMPTVAPPSPPQPTAAPTPAKVPIQPAATMTPAIPTPHTETPELQPPPPKALESVRTTEIEPTPLPQPIVHERHTEPAAHEPVQSTPSIQAIDPASHTGSATAEPSQPMKSPLPPLETPVPQPPSQSMVAESTSPDVGQSSEVAAPSSPPPQVASLASTTAPATPKTDYGWLSETIVRRVEQLKRYPADARLEQAQGKVVVKVVIREDGSVVDVEVIKSSGFQSLDQAALDLMHQAGPFNLTRPLGKPTLAIRVPINYAIDRP